MQMNEITKEVKMKALYCGINVVEAWARDWLSGKDRTAKSAEIALMVCVREVVLLGKQTTVWVTASDEEGENAEAAKVWAAWAVNVAMVAAAGAAAGEAMRAAQERASHE